MKTKDLIYLGVPEGEPMRHARDFIDRYLAEGNDAERLGEEIFQIVADASAHFADPLRAPLARSIYRPPFTP
ncbi:MAG: RtcB family protein, partial [Verrucomicrobiaceae bacterium]